MLVYDLLLYIWRSITYEVPYIGGRARGKDRPRAPSLRDRNGSHERKTQDMGSATPSSGEDDVGHASATDLDEAVRRAGNYDSKPRPPNG